MNKIAIVLVGGICSGKTTFADRMEKLYGFTTISKDRCIYESDMRHRKNDCISWEDVREEHIAQLYGQNVVIDETIRIGKLKELKAKGYTIIAVKLESDRKIREERLAKRNISQKNKLRELSKITSIDLYSCAQDVRRNYWRNEQFCDNIKTKYKERFNTILHELYLLGSSYIKDEEPNPICFNEIDYIVDLQSVNCFESINISYLKSKMIIFNEYKKKWAEKIKYCIWDVGGVFYDYSLDNLNNWCQENTTNIVLFNERRGTYSFNDYMLGNIDFNELCIKICEYYSIVYSTNIQEQIGTALRNGIGKDFSVTAKIINAFENRGIINCVLSNALPILAEIGNYPNLIKRENRFYSFDLKALKPNNLAYKMVRDSLNTTFEEMIFIDDKVRNTDAATELGIYSIVFQKDTIKQRINNLLGFQIE